MLEEYPKNGTKKFQKKFSILIMLYSLSLVQVTLTNLTLILRSMTNIYSISNSLED